MSIERNMSKQIEGYKVSGLQSKLPSAGSENRYLPHETHYNDAHANFERIRDRRLWDKLEKKRAANEGRQL